jgi:PAS domain S-box-containing protein
MACDERIEALWKAMVNEPTVGVGVVDLSGRILYANRQLTEMFLGESDPSKVVGKTLRDIFPKAAADQRLELISRLQSPDDVIVLRTLWRGRGIKASYRLTCARDDPEGEPEVLVLAHYVGPDGPIEEVPGAEVVESSSVELGPLEVLSVRELEVLALLGQGMSIEEIARALHRSPHTIRHHRESIASKLGEANRVKLARFAARAGLRVEDATKRREKPKRADEGQ